MVKKNISLIANEDFPNAKCIIGLNLTDFEIDFIKSLIKIHNFSTIDFSEIKNINPLKNELIFLREFNLVIIKDLLDWCFEISVVGRSANDQKSDLQNLGIIRFWDLDVYPLQEFPLFQIKKTDYIKIQSAVLSFDPIFNLKINSLFMDFQIQSLITKNSSEFFFTIRNEEISFIILDWDMPDEIIQNISNELKKIKTQKGSLPPIFGIKDFQKQDLFADLSLIRNFCEVLFSKEEILQLLIHSLPVKTKTELPTKKTKQLDWTISNEGKILTYSLREIYMTKPDFKLENQKKLYSWMF